MCLSKRTKNCLSGKTGIELHRLVMKIIISSSNKTDRHDITEILLQAALNTVTLTVTLYMLNHLPFRSL
jgi:hypothetical protein